ncbi:MAG: hypothetical protein ACK5JT_09000 [Hyphomicrobiaceae bacterium]
MDNSDDIDMLAGEYVLGSLTDEERALVARRIAGGDDALANAVADWERRLAPLNHQTPAIAPPSTILPRLLNAISADSVQSVHDRTNVIVLRRQAQRWRRAAQALAASLAAVAIAFGAIAYTQWPQGASDRLGLLDGMGVNSAADDAPAQAGPAFLVRFREGLNWVEFHQLRGPRLPTGRVLVGWVTRPGVETAIRLGQIMDQQRPTRLRMPVLDTGELANIVFLITMEKAEPSQGLPSRPLGPVIYRGKLQLL